MLKVEKGYYIYRTEYE